MTKTAWYSGRVLTWRDIPAIYKSRLQRLWRSLIVNFFAAVILIAVLIMIPMFMGIALFSGHYVWTALALIIALLAAGTLYWKSFQIASRRG